MLRNVIYFEYFMPMSHGVNKKVLFHSSPFTKCAPDFFAVLQESPYKTSFFSDQVIAKNNVFSN